MKNYQNPSLPVNDRVEDLLAQMTLEEKAAQLCGDLPFDLAKLDGSLEDALKERYPHGHGRFTQYSIVGLADPTRIAAFTNRLQKYFVEETRLGIPVALQSENLCGYPAMGGTLFPSQLNAACTWNPQLVKKMAEIIGQESRSVGINSAMSPVIDVSRDPRWGRTYETYGEDPYLISQMGTHYIQGMQADKENGVACIAKHFLGYGESQGGLNMAVARINNRELYEIFGTPFEAAMREADVSSVMANYGEIDGMCVVANRAIAHDLLRDTMKFEGILTSDGAGILKTFTDFHTADTYEEAGLLAKKAGTDTEIPVGASFAKLPEYVRAGLLEESLLDESVRRVLKVKFEYGLFEHPYVDEVQVGKVMSSKVKQKVSKQLAAQSLILLKNDDILPLSPDTKIAVIGPHGDSLRYPVSGYTFPAYVEMLTAGAKDGSSISFNGLADEAAKAKTTNTESPFTAFFSALTQEDKDRIGDMNQVLRSMGAVTLFEALSEFFPTVYAKGCDILGTDDSLIPEAVEAARKSDVVILACGGNAGWVNVTGGEGKDRCRLDLPGVQQQLFDALVSAGKKLILVLYGPGIFALPEDYQRASGILQAFLPGPYGAEAVAAVLKGDLNPSGKLPVTIPRNIGQLPVTYNHRTGSGYANIASDPSSHIFTGGYVDEDSQPLYCFGHGLSYTTFTLSDFSLSEPSVPTDGQIRLSCCIQNTGDRPGDQVVQLYIHTKKAHVIRPVKELAGFVRVSLTPSEKKAITFCLDTSQLGFYNENMEFVVEPTRMDVMVGTSSHEICFCQEIQLTGPKRSVMGKRSYTCQVQVS